ncbi:CAP domain-containing protein [Haloferula chungangensis]|uniref:CAP domain-containing protein n=1 Tax=Haloferula chungangensis TaxID=1048331 RepID=A0ABW2L817_9BACT
MKVLLFASLIATACHSFAGQAADELLAAFQTNLENGRSIEPLCESLNDVDGSVLRDLNQQLNKAWPLVSDRYYTALQSASKQDGGSNQSQIRQLREDFMEVYSMGEAKMKPLLKTISMPAVEKLRKLIAPTPNELVAAGSPELKALRDAALKLGTFRDASLNAEISTTPSNSVQSMRAREREIAESASALPREGLRVLAKNRSTAEKDEIPAEEARGIEECNLWRLYLGLSALELDPKLCDASRDHSKDMAEQQFFAHDSPVKGKTTPWDRAANFDTTSSGENIYMGSTDPHAANLGWFYSPGHHKNMFNAAQKRIGLGRYGRHWTQMFGR